MRRDVDHIYDEYLVAAARAGDRDALERLAKRFGTRLLAHAWRLTNDADIARDTTQDAWVEIIRGLPRLSDAAAFPAWAFRIVTRRCAKSIRRVQHRRLLSQALINEAAVDNCTIADPAFPEDGFSIAAALATLPAEQRATVALFYLEDFSVAEIAVALGIPAGTVKTRLMHARRKLRAVLEGVDHA
jgi:RNA polymerase sigma-70 factor (ECF subfamily)